MAEPFDWEALYGDYIGHWSAVFSGSAPDKEFQAPVAAVRRLTSPTDGDVRWLTDALKDEGDMLSSRKWLVANLARHGTPLPEALFQPLLDAAIDEIDPSYNRDFVEPCMESFGPRRVNEYLLDVVESGTDRRKAGAVNALYWAHVPLTFPGDAPSFDREHATRESRAAYEELHDIWDRTRRLLLETFVQDEDVDVRRSIIPSLDLDPRNYPEGHRVLVMQAIQIARNHSDEYIRHRVEVQLGDASGGLAPLPHRDSEEPTG